MKSKHFLNIFNDKYALILILAPLLFIAIGFFEDGINVDSTTYSVVARNFAEHGHWMSPSYTTYFLPHFSEHPPLVMWFLGIIFKLFGASDPTSRIFGALCVIGSIFFVYLIGKEIKSREFGFLAGLILLLTYNFIQIGNSAMLDVPMIFFVLAGLWAFIKALNQSSKKRYFILTGIFLALGFLAKGITVGPAWAAVGVDVIFLRRDFLRNYRFYLAPLMTILIIGAFLLGDYIYNDALYSSYYFGDHIARSLEGVDVVNKPEIYEYIYKFAKLYFPFILLLIPGLYFTFKQKLTRLYPILITLFIYLIFHSLAKKLFYHYFIPAYALSALPAAVTLNKFVREKAIRYIATWFPVLWVILALIVVFTGTKIHLIRSKEIYNATAQMTAFLSNQEYRAGIYMTDGNDDWDYIAKTTWYWRSDVRRIYDFNQAAELLKRNDEFAYILATPKFFKSEEVLDSLGLHKYLSNGKIEIYTLP